MPYAAVRPLVDDALAQPHGRGADRGAVAGETQPCGQDRGDEAGRHAPGDPRISPRTDTTVQPKNVMFPTDAKLIHRARERLVRLAKRTGLHLRQSYVRVGKLALISHQRYAHAKQFKRANKALRRLKTMSAGPFATLVARSPAMRGWTRSSNGRSTRPPPFSSNVSASASARSTACTRTRWNALAREGAYALRVRGEGVGGHHAEASGRPVRPACKKRCPAIPMAATRSQAHRASATSRLSTG